jgi:hypothetical protein
MSKHTSIMSKAAEVETSVRTIGADGGSVALAVALGKLCAQSGISLQDAVALAEIAHREQVIEQVIEQERADGRQVAA